MIRLYHGHVGTNQTTGREFLGRLSLNDSSAVRNPTYLSILVIPTFGIWWRQEERRGVMVQQQPPRYLQIAGDLRRQIELGALTPDSSDPTILTPGKQLPTELELIDLFNASRNTVRDAIKHLMGQGLVETRRGQGTFVIRKMKPFVTVLSIDPETGQGGGGEEGATYPAMVSRQGRKTGAGEDAEIRIVACPPEIARLKVLKSDKVVSRQQQRLIDGTIWSLQTSYYPLEWVTKGASKLLMPENIEEGTVQYLGETLKLKRAGYRDWVTARSPGPKEQTLFVLPHDATVFEIFRASFAEDGTPMLITSTVYPSDRNHIVYEYGDVPELEFDQDPK
jgi:GntR family transcriptional regulator